MIDKLQDLELRESLKRAKENLDKEWNQLKPIIKAYTPRFFPEDAATPVFEDFALFNWAANFVSTRDFGFDVPHTHLAPLIDMANHTDISNTDVDLFHLKLHTANNKIYDHRYETELDYSDPDQPKFKFEARSHRKMYNVRHIYEKMGKATEEIQEQIKGKDQKDLTSSYNGKAVFDRFSLLYEFENSQSSLRVKNDLVEKGNVSEASYEEAKR